MGEKVTIPRAEYERLLALAEDAEDAAAVARFRAKFSDTQSILLTAAAQRPDGNLLPLPGSLRGGAAAKVVAELLARGFAEEQNVESTAKADPAPNPLWRNADDGRGILLRITPALPPAGLDALGIGADSATVGATGAGEPISAAESRAGTGSPENREVARTGVRHLLILTSFLGIDVSFGEGEPACFETRVLDNLDELECSQHSTWTGALGGHDALTKRWSRWADAVWSATERSLSEPC